MGQKNMAKFFLLLSDFSVEKQKISPCPSAYTFLNVKPLTLGHQCPTYMGQHSVPLISYGLRQCLTYMGHHSVPLIWATTVSHLYGPPQCPTYMYHQCPTYMGHQCDARGIDYKFLYGFLCGLVPLLQYL